MRLRGKALKRDFDAVDKADAGRSQDGKHSVSGSIGAFEFDGMIEDGSAKELTW